MSDDKPKLYRAAEPVEGSALHRLLTPPESPKKGPRTNEEEPWEVQAMVHFNNRLSDIEGRIIKAAVAINEISDAVERLALAIDKITCALEEGASAKR